MIFFKIDCNLLDRIAHIQFAILNITKKGLFMITRTTKDIIATCWKVAGYEYSLSHHQRSILTKFKSLVLDMENHKPTPEEAVIRVYDFNRVVTSNYSHLHRHIDSVLFWAFNMTEPKARQDCVSCFFGDPQYTKAMNNMYKELYAKIAALKKEQKNQLTTAPAPGK
jgi:hypothetical protein